MDSDTEFPMPNYSEREAISHYLQIEHKFMATKDFYKTAYNRQHRKHAVAIIARLSQGQVHDAYVAYLAMNYFDRFASTSTNPFTVVRGSSVTDKVCFIATCCFTLSAKMRTTKFELQKFLAEKKLSYEPNRLMKMESRILNELDCRMPTVTPFFFLDHYYPTFKTIGGFKRGSINEIIVQSQGECHFTQFKPSDIAISAFLAATFIGYPSKFNAIEKSIDQSGELKGCWSQLAYLCHKRNIEICSASGTVISATKIAAKPPTQSEEAAAAEIQTTKSEEELSELVELQVQNYSTTKATQFMVLDTEEGEEENVAPSTRRPRQDRGLEGVEATEEGAEAETEATKQQGEDQGKAVTVADASEQKDVEAETKVNPKEQDKGVGEIEEICEETVEGETELIPAAEAALVTLTNIQLRWPTSHQNINNIVRRIHARELGNPKVLPKPKIDFPPEYSKFANNLMTIVREAMESRNKGNRVLNVRASGDEMCKFFRLMKFVSPEGLSITEGRPSYFKVEVNCDDEADLENFEDLLLDILLDMYYENAIFL